MPSIKTLNRKNGKAYKAIVRKKGPDGKIIKKYKTFDRKTDARRWGLDLEREIEEGKDVQEAPALEELIDIYLSTELPRLKGELQQRRRRVMVEWWRSRLGRRWADLIRPAEVSRYLDEIGGATSTRNRYKSVLGRVFKMAIKRGDVGRWVDPTAGLHVGENNERSRVLTTEERETLLRTVQDDPELNLFVRIAMTTGMRQGEIAKLRWRDCDFENQVIRVEADTQRDASKSGKQRLVPMLAQVERLLRERNKVRRIDTDLVFPGKTGKPSWPHKRWEAAVRKSGIKNFRYHDLRHTAASILTSRGVGLHELMHILGHKTAQATKRYVHLTRQHVAESIRDRMVDIDAEGL